MASNPKHKWTFSARFRRSAFGWRSQPAIQRVKEAVSEIKKAARKDPILGAEGAVLFLEKLSPAIEQVDGSSGAMGTAVNNAIEALVPIIASAPAADELRDRWLDRLWRAVQEDGIPYIELLPDYWGELCVTPERASIWADEFIDLVRAAWTDDYRYGYFNGITACLSSLLQAGRYDEILELLDLQSQPFWSYSKWGVKALAAQGRKGEAIRYAENADGRNCDPVEIALVCEEILLSSGMAEEAYRRYAFKANQKTTYLATFNAIVKKYPSREPAAILRDLVDQNPGAAGKWFAAAKSAGLYDLAVELANRSSCDPKTLIRAARDMEAKEPRFALEAGVAAIRWLVAGYGYEITALDVWAAYDYAMAAAENAGCGPETRERIRELVAAERLADKFVTKALGKELGLS